MKLTNHNKVLYVIIAVLIFIICYNPKTQTTKPDVKLELLELQNNRLREAVNDRDSIIFIHQSKIDSLEALKPKIRIKYEIIYKDIDRMPVDNLLIKFDSIFASKGVNR